MVRWNRSFGSQVHAAISTHRRFARNALDQSWTVPNQPLFGPGLLTRSPSAPSMEQSGASSPMATIDEEMSQLEKDIRQLKIEYDQFFGGGRKRPPSEIEWRIETIIKRYAERGGELKFGQRFKYNNLTQTYAKYKDIFRKKVQQKEEGKVQRHFGAAAKAIEAERAKATAAASPAPQPTAFRMICSEPESEPAKVDQLYRAFQDAMQQTGGSVKQSRENFADFVSKKTKELQKQKNCREVEYVVEVVNGEVKLKALVKA
ncbi:MAG TPA: MXAN_5187 C-terminal domain-containing protein [Candidatus Acidoferrum sp.]|nr:MXAN_5187 C-terminal domain-containing protein [Candidatus Acidoferrum sp.]